MDRDSQFILRKVLIDLLLLACVGFPILFFFLWGKPYERGFYCDDESLRHPFHPSTVTSAMLYGVGLCLPILMMFFSEYINHRGKKNHKVHHFLGVRIPPWVWSSYNVVGVFGFGVACQQLTTDIAKYTVGRLRPHFFDVCRPLVNCTAPENKWRYIEEFECDSTADPHLIKEMRLSFPSGHSSFSTFTMIYIAVYLQCRLRWSGSKLLRHGIQFVFLMLAWYTVLSRISDYKHHWSDVLGGACIGIITSILVFGCVSDLWRPRPPVPPRLRENNDMMRHANGENGAPVAAV